MPCATLRIAEYPRAAGITRCRVGLRLGIGAIYVDESLRPQQLLAVGSEATVIR